MTNQVPLDDRGLLLGDGLFETVLAENGALVDFDAHLARMIRGCEVLGLPAPTASLAREAAHQALVARGLDAQRAAVRLTWTAGSGGRGLDRPAAPAPRLLASAAPAPRPDGPVKLATATVRRNDGSPAARLKSLAYLDNVLARREAVARGAAEALMLNSRGEIACAASANIFWVRKDRIFTPALECGVLDGVMRSRVLAAAEVEQVRAPAEALREAQAVFLTNSLIGVRAVSHLDAIALGHHPKVDWISQACASPSITV